MSKHYTINIRVTETEEAEGSSRTHPGHVDRRVEETANITVRAETMDEALRKVSVIIPAL